MPCKLHRYAHTTQQTLPCSPDSSANVGATGFTTAAAAATATAAASLLCIARIEEQKKEPGYVMNKVDYFVNHCTSTYLCKRAFMKTLEVHETSTGTKFGLKERQELYVTEPFLAARCLHLQGCSLTNAIGCASFSLQV
jgi:hypothetical protein